MFHIICRIPVDHQVVLFRKIQIALLIVVPWGSVRIVHDYANHKQISVSIFDQMGNERLA